MPGGVGSHVNATAIL
ncbi:hypothetical protein N7463_000214 [Penicillium fimorum]|uniref:Uncharacterized protein n=1 Tax=Penicillium fimorum TaxID=1882269 RepID=A0A9X0CAQ4_9EURO|nr:hypothetical protein N7463_000214 [Penicillium fimorum]